MVLGLPREKWPKLRNFSSCSLANPATLLNKLRERRERKLVEHKG